MKTMQTMNERRSTTNTATSFDPEAFVAGIIELGQSGDPEIVAWCDALDRARELRERDTAATLQPHADAA